MALSLFSSAGVHGVLVRDFLAGRGVSSGGAAVDGPATVFVSVAVMSEAPPRLGWMLGKESMAFLLVPAAGCRDGVAFTGAGLRLGRIVWGRGGEKSDCVADEKKSDGVASAGAIAAGSEVAFCFCGDRFRTEGVCADLETGCFWFRRCGDLWRKWMSRWDVRRMFPPISVPPKRKEWGKG